jgi:hypothetical protein
MKRTDVHAPSSPKFDPEAYAFSGVFDNDSDWGDHAARRQAVSALVDQGYSFGHGGSNSCGHCGAQIRYAALMVRADVKEFIFVGQDCLNNRFEELTKAEFQALRKTAKLNKDRATRKEKADAIFAANPWLSEIPTYGGDFLDSLYERARDGKELSERQIETGQVALQRAKEREVKFQAQAAADAVLIAQGVQAPEGKVTVTGEVVSVKWHDNDFGGALKMVVQSDEGWKVWVTVPKSLQGTSALVSGGEWKFTEDVSAGQRVEFTATLTRSDRDPLFAFGKRPTKAKILDFA